MSVEFNPSFNFFKVFPNEVPNNSEVQEEYTDLHENLLFRGQRFSRVVVLSSWECPDLSCGNTSQLFKNTFAAKITTKEHNIDPESIVRLCELDVHYDPSQHESNILIQDDILSQTLVNIEVKTYETDLELEELVITIATKRKFSQLERAFIAIGITIFAVAIIGTLIASFASFASFQIIPIAALSSLGTINSLVLVGIGAGLSITFLSASVTFYRKAKNSVENEFRNDSYTQFVKTQTATKDKVQEQINFCRAIVDSLENLYIDPFKSRLNTLNILLNNPWFNASPFQDDSLNLLGKLKKFQDFKDNIDQLSNNLKFFEACLNVRSFDSYHLTSTADQLLVDIQYFSTEEFTTELDSLFKELARLEQAIPQDFAEAQSAINFFTTFLEDVSEQLHFDEHEQFLQKLSDIFNSNFLDKGSLTTELQRLEKEAYELIGQFKDQMQHISSQPTRKNIADFKEKLNLFNTDEYKKQFSDFSHSLRLFESTIEKNSKEYDNFCRIYEEFFCKLNENFQLAVYDKQLSQLEHMIKSCSLKSEYKERLDNLRENFDEFFSSYIRKLEDFKEDPTRENMEKLQKKLTKVFTSDYLIMYFNKFRKELKGLTKEVESRYSDFLYNDFYQKNKADLEDRFDQLLLRVNFLPLEEKTQYQESLDAIRNQLDAFKAVSQANMKQTISKIQTDLSKLSATFATDKQINPDSYYSYCGLNSQLEKEKGSIFEYHYFTFKRISESIGNNEFCIIPVKHLYSNQKTYWAALFKNEGLTHIELIGRGEKELARQRCAQLSLKEVRIIDEKTDQGKQFILDYHKTLLADRLKTLDPQQFCIIPLEKCALNQTFSYALLAKETESDQEKTTIEIITKRQIKKIESKYIENDFIKISIKISDHPKEKEVVKDNTPNFEASSIEEAPYEENIIINEDPN